MSETETETDGRSLLARLEELIPKVADGLERLKVAIVENTDDEEIIELAEELWEIVEATRALLETVDFEELPDTIHVQELSDAIEAGDIPEAISEGEAREAIDLSEVKDAVELRELWEAVDLSELREEKARLEGEIDDVTGDERSESEDDGFLGTSGVMGSGGGAHMQFDAEARQEKIQNLIMKSVEKFRAALLETHDKVRLLYEFNQQKLGGRESLNPTAVSTMPSGPIPNSASTRRSTVPSQVKYSRANNPRRIYGRRFEDANTEGDTDE